MEKHFLAESNTIENAILPNKTAQSKASGKKNRMENTKCMKCTYHEELSFTANYFFFFFKKKLIWL